MDYYEAWFELKESSKDLEFAANLDRYMSHLRDQGLIEGYRLARRKLGFGPSDLGDFHLTIDVRDLAQLERAFGVVKTREPEIEKFHAPVYSAVKNIRFALFRDFPDRPAPPSGGS